MNYIKNNKVPQLACKKKCTGCLACVSSCPKNALSPYVDNDGHVYVRRDEEKCIGCKKCEIVCKNSRKSYGDNDLVKSKIYAAWVKDDDIRKKSTSGGIFAALAKTVINQGGVVVGASLENRECKHIVISKIDDIEKLQGSKYLSSSMAGIYEKIEKKLNKGLVLFTGTGCQCAGILAYFKNNKYKDNLITVDLVCGGYPSKILTDKYYENHKDVDKILSFRTKDKYILKVLKNKKLVEIKEKNLPLHGFNCELTNRYNCYNCQFAKAHRKTDITIGDLWNYNLFKDEHSKGISTVILHSPIGKKIILSSDINLEAIKWEDSVNYCKRIVWGKTPIFLPRRLLIKNSQKMKEDKFEKLYCMNMKITDIWLFIFKLYRFIIMRINTIIAKIYIKYMLNKNKHFLNAYKGEKND